MSEVPKDAREQIEALIRNQPVGYERQGSHHPPVWLLRLALSALDAQEAAGEELCVDEGCPHHGTPHVCLSRKEVSLYNAGERAGLKKAAKMAREQANKAEWSDHFSTAADYRRLADRLDSLKGGTP